MHTRAIALITCLMAQPALAQSTVDIQVDQARAIAAHAVRAGDVQLAQEIARQLLAQDPDDRTALLILAATATQSENPTEGRTAGARAWRLSQTAPQKYEAARLTALAAAKEERFTLSTLWLRRALTVAPNDAEYAQTLADARIIKRRNPWSTHFGFSVVPSDNVNGGAEGTTLTAPGNPTGTLSDDARALSGIRASFSLRTRYRLHENKTSRTTVGLKYSGARVRLTDDIDIPDDAFDTNAAELSLRYDRALPHGNFGLNASVGVSDYREATTGDQDVEFQKYDILRFGLSYQTPLSDRSKVALAARTEQLSYLEEAIGEVQRNTLSMSYIHALSSGDSWHASISATDSVGDSVNYTSNTMTIQGGYNWKDPIGPVTISVGAGYTRTDYPDYRLLYPVTGGRTDDTLFYNINVGFPDATYAGFTPGLSLNRSLSESNVSRYTRDSMSVGITLKSVF
ncbi:surface lipoprotein assembly modifier [Yoonia maritima]|uniref:surface lipoprotein assembly modifier n=1 Tax=Yoonia maritima TaxID=1435347 RepID=UPI000D105771|nr:surface lipoprotein assembly modifier [Yoonia maritima]